MRASQTKGLHQEIGGAAGTDVGQQAVGEPTCCGHGSVGLSPGDSREGKEKQ